MTIEIPIAVDFGGTDVLTGVMAKEGKATAEPMNFHTRGEDEPSLQVAKLAEGVDSTALAIWGEFGEHIPVAVSWAINLTDPSLIILCGSISSAFAFRSSSMEESIRSHICLVPSEKTMVVWPKVCVGTGLTGAVRLTI